jgi:NADH-quinone oxidoreductase subunit A
VAQYLPLVVMFVLAAAFAGVSLLMSRLLNPKRPTAAKIAPYECGIVPTRDAPERFPVSFYLVAMLFIMFDIEIVFLYPYAVSAGSLGAYGFGAIVLFSAVFFLSFVYEVAKGGLDWGPLQRERRLEASVSADRTSSTTVRRVGLEGRSGQEEAA